MARELKAIILGGGPTGLTLAHILHHAGIDFVVLERRSDVTEDVGASLVLSPHNLRVYHQLGILPQLITVGAGLRSHSTGATSNGGYFKRGSSLELIRRKYANAIGSNFQMMLTSSSHGCHLMAFHRADIHRILYSSLPDMAKKRVLLGQKAVQILESPLGVEVVCSDGTLHHGRFVIGADGVHSVARTFLNESAGRLHHRIPLKHTYRCLWASFPRLSDSGQSYETQGKDRSIMYLAGAQKAWLFLYEKIEDPMNTKQHYDKANVDAFAASFSEWQITETLRVRDCFGNHFRAGMTNLQEGVEDCISWGGKVVLVGDSWHKFTPNSGLGFNNGIQDAVVLSNQLRKLHLAMNESLFDQPKMDRALQDAFDSYHHHRSQEVHRDFGRSYQATRLSAWSTTYNWFLAQFVYTNRAVETYLTVPSIAAAIQAGHVLDFIKSKEPFEGLSPWIHKMAKDSSS